ncbi:MAG: hypothetical protein QM802_12105 [Agriterribacter sp.]
MKYAQVFVLLLTFVFCTSCGVKNKTDLSKENIKAEKKDTVISRRSTDPDLHSRYEYIDAAGKRVIIQNGYPRGGSRYTDPNGEVYGYAVFWSRIINETDDLLELKFDFLDSYEVPSMPGKHFKIVVPPDTMTRDKEGLFNYGLTNVASFLDNSIHKPSSLKRTINPKESGGFYFLKLSPVSEGLQGGGDILRTELILKGQALFYSVSVYNSSPTSSVVISEKDIECGSINLKSLRLLK